MLEEKTWREFKEIGLLWWINRMLHLFGWAVIFEYDKNDELARVYPARCKFRGYCYDVEEAGFRNLSGYLADTADVLKEEADQ